MLKKKIFNIKFSKILLPITKRIESFFDAFENFIKNKKKYLNLWKKSSLEKKIFIPLAITFLAFIGYFLLPSFYDQEKLKKHLTKQILQEYNLDVKFDKDVKYGLFPKPHFYIKDLELKYNSSIVSKSKYLKVFFSSKNNFEFDNIKINNLFFSKTDFKINRTNYKFFLDLLNYEFFNKDIRFKKSRIFYLDQNEDIIFLSELKKIDYLYQEDSVNKLLANIELFNLPIDIKIDHDISKRNIFSEINLKSLNLKIKNDTTYKSNNFEGDIDFKYITKDLKVSYSLKANNLILHTADKKFTSEINIKPFFLLSNLNLENVKVKNIFGNNSLFENLLKSEIFYNKNINARVSVSINGLNDLNHIDNMNFEIKFEEGEIFISNLNFQFKDFTTFKFNNINLIVEENNLKLLGDITLEFDDIQGVYNYFQISRKYRKNISKISSNFIFDFDNELFEFSDLKIIGIKKQISDKYLRKFNSEKKDLFNKVILKNTVRDFFKKISLD